MKDKFLKDLPIYLNGFAVGWIFWGITSIGIFDISMFVLAIISFFWYGEKQKIRNTGKKLNKNLRKYEIK